MQVTQAALRRAANDPDQLSALLDPLAAEAAAGSLGHLERLVWAVDELRLAEYTIRRLVLDELDAEDVLQDVLGQPYLVLDLADRGDLATRVGAAREQGRPPSPDGILAVGQAVGRALDALHRNHLVHRDLAPKNLLLCSTSGPAIGVPWPDPRLRGSPGPPTQPLVAADEQIYLADLGLSKDLAIASGLTVATGTSGFAPPEQREHGGTVDSRADIWAASAPARFTATVDGAASWGGSDPTARWSSPPTRPASSSWKPRPPVAPLCESSPATSRTASSKPPNSST